MSRIPHWLCSDCRAPTPWLVSQGVFGGSAAADGCRRWIFFGPFRRRLKRAVKRRNPGPLGPGIPLSGYVRKGGLEPPRPKAQEPKSCVSANFTTRARRRRPRFCCDALGASDRTVDGGCQAPLYLPPEGAESGGLAGQEASPRSRRSLATWPVARTLYCATATFPSGSTTMVDRISPS
jgi:hypothetical protein